MRHRRHLVIVGCLVAVLAGTACDREPTAPPTGVRLHVVTVDTLAAGQGLVKLVATVTNSGPARLVYRTSCGPYTWFAAYDEQGNAVRLRSPLGGEVCPFEPSVLEPWATAGAELLFGHTWDATGTPFRPAPGRYTIYTRFIWDVPGAGATRRVDARTVIDWE